MPSSSDYTIILLLRHGQGQRRQEMASDTYYGALSFTLNKEASFSIHSRSVRWLRTASRSTRAFAFIAVAARQVGPRYVTALPRTDRIPHEHWLRPGCAEPLYSSSQGTPGILELRHFQNRIAGQHLHSTNT